VEYKKGLMIYNQDQPSTNIYLIIAGKIKVSRVADDGHQVVVDIYQPDEFFGESAFLNLPHRCEQATALENTKVMAWTTAEIEDLILKRPRLSVALVQILVQRTIDFTHRIESFSVDNIARRLARSLIRFSDRLGTAEEDGSVRMAPFTQGNHTLPRRLPRLAAPERIKRGPRMPGSGSRGTCADAGVRPTIHSECR